LVGWGLVCLEGAEKNYAEYAEVVEKREER
jgi:hypothetical protein